MQCSTHQTPGATRCFFAAICKETIRRPFFVYIGPAAAALKTVEEPQK
jgi:hypothetical protein